MDNGIWVLGGGFKFFFFFFKHLGEMIQFDAMRLDLNMLKPPTNV